MIFIQVSMHKPQLLVIGNGMAGSRFVAELCARGGAEKYAITVFGEERGGAYNRILLSDVLNGSKTAQSIETHSPDWYAARGIGLVSGAKIVRVNPQTREVETDRGETHFYDELVFATGSRAAIPPIAGLHDADGARKSGVFVMRTLEDCERIASFATKARRAAVLGGGLLGLEAARGLVQHGAKVHLVHRSAVLMSAQLDQIASQMLQRDVEKMGITVHLGKNTREIVGQNGVEALRFSDETLLPCDMIVIATGISPNVELAREAGLPVETAILVDDELRVQEGIWAIGECAQHRGQTYGLVAPAWDQARVLAQNLCGQSAKYEGTKTATKLKVMGVELSAMGTPVEQDGDEVIEYREARRGKYKKIIIRDGKIAGAILRHAKKRQFAGLFRAPNAVAARTRNAAFQHRKKRGRRRQKPARRRNGV